jgi:hypothetical protein
VIKIGIVFLFNNFFPRDVRSRRIDIDENQVGVSPGSEGELAAGSAAVIDRLNAIILANSPDMGVRQI